MPDLSSPLRDYLGAKTAKALDSGLDLHTIGDLLRHYPRRYAERGEVTDLASLRVGDHVTVMAKVQRVNVRPMRQRRGRLLEVTVGDDRRSLTLTFFNQAWRERDLQVGRSGLFAGKVTEFRGKRQLNSPDYQLLAEVGSDAADEQLEEFAGTLIPVYPATAAVPTWAVAKCVRTVLGVLGPLPDPLPEDLRDRHRLVGLITALTGIHRPASAADLGPARTRLKWDEAMAVQVTLAQRRAAAAARPATPRPARPGGLAEAFDDSLPFGLTDGQRQVGTVLADELGEPHPMHRLLQGEVGSGKTVCAVRAMLQVVDAGGQAALLAPTEVLAAQHHRSIGALLGPMARAGGSRRCSAHSGWQANWVPPRRRPGSRCSPGRSPPAPAGRHLPRRPPAMPASSSAPTRSFRRGSSSATSGWSSLTSSTGSVSSSVTRCAPRARSRRTSS